LIIIIIIEELYTLFNPLHVAVGWSDGDRWSYWWRYFRFRSDYGKDHQRWCWSSLQVSLSLLAICYHYSVSTIAGFWLSLIFEHHGIFHKYTVKTSGYCMLH